MFLHEAKQITRTYLLLRPCSSENSRSNFSDNSVQVSSSMHSNVQLLYLLLFLWLQLVFDYRTRFARKPVRTGLAWLQLAFDYGTKFERKPVRIGVAWLKLIFDYGTRFARKPVRTGFVRAKQHGGLS